MRWLWRRVGTPNAEEGKELAKTDDALHRQRVIADVLVESSTELAHEHRWLLYANHFGPNAAKALREAHR
jgi:hypothetical protein